MLRKHLLTFVLLSLTGILSAQSLQFEMDGTPLADGQTIVCPYFEDLMLYTQTLHLRNLTDNELSVIIEQEIIETVSGSSISFCWGRCYNPGQNLSDPVAIPAQTLSTSLFSIEIYIPEGAAEITTVKYYAYDESNPDEKICLIAQSGNYTHVTENTFSMGNAYPNPASSQVHFDYKMGGHADINVVVYNLLGQEVKSQAIYGTQGTVDIAVNDLQPGVYFCSFTADGKPWRTEKFIVKR